MRRLIVAVDFDHCLVNSENHGKAISLKPHAKEVIRKYSGRGVRFVLNTSRYGLLLWRAIWFIKMARLPIKFRPCLVKVKADVYIDDCNIFTKTIDWKEIDKELNRIMGGEK